MISISRYSSPIGEMTLASKNAQLIGVWFNNQKYFLGNIKEEVIIDDNLKIFKETKNWLDRYFKGEKVSCKELDICLLESEFQILVWEMLCDIPYGCVTTYKEIAKMVAEKRGCLSMSCQAVGGAVGHNPISIIVPCHRVIGSDGKLTGYAGGIDKKKYLLDLESSRGKLCIE